jgi:transketolase
MQQPAAHGKKMKFPTFRLSKMKYQKQISVVLVSMIICQSVIAHPQHSQQQIASYNQQLQQQQQQRQGQIPEYQRKFAEKPNALKKVALDDIDDDIQTNQISDNGFSWSNMLGECLSCSKKYTHDTFSLSFSLARSQACSCRCSSMDNRPTIRWRQRNLTTTESRHRHGPTSSRWACDS